MKSDIRQSINYQERDYITHARQDVVPCPLHQVFCKKYQEVNKYGELHMTSVDMCACLSLCECVYVFGHLKGVFLLLYV